MTEDTRKWANANATTFKRISSTTTNFGVAQRWQQEASREAQGDDFSDKDSESAPDRLSRPGGASGEVH